MAEPAIVHPKACLKIGEIRLWGRLDVVELTPGVTPNSTTLICPKSEFSKLAGDYDQAGDLELYWSSETVPDVTLKSWSIDHVEETLHGNLPGGAAEPLELTVALTDRRWEMTGGRGGTAFWGVLNKSTEDGKAVTQNVAIEGITGTTGWTWYDVIRTLGVKLKCASGGYRLDPDYSPPVALAAMAKPRDWAVDGENIPAAIAKACEACEAVWTVSTDGQYYVYQIGSDTLPGSGPPGVVRIADLPAGKRLPTTGYISRSMRAGAVVITSAPQPRIVQETMGMKDGEDKPLWLYVGVDRDGSIKELANLTYVVESGKTPLVLIRDYFRHLSEADRMLALGSFGRMFRMNITPSRTRLPLLTRLAESVADSDDEIRGLGVRVEGKIAIKVGQDYVNSDDYVPVGIARVDHVHGIITSWFIVGKTEVLCDSPCDVFEFCTGDDLKFTIAHESRANGNYQDYWCQAYSMAGGVVVEADLATTMAADTADVRIVSMPELRAYVVAGSVTNDDELSAFAASVAGRLLRDPAASETLQYIGLHNIAPSGTVSAVRWDLSRGITTIEHNTYHISACRFLVRDAHGRVARAAKAGGAGASSAPQLSSQGSGRWASPPDTLMGRADADAGPRALRVKITASELVSGETDKWAYTAVRTRKIDAEHGGDAVWEPYDTEHPLTLYNDAEWPTGGPLPVGNSTPVWAWPQFYTSGSPAVRTKEWWFCMTADGQVAYPPQMLPSGEAPNAEAAQTDAWDALSPPENTAGTIARQFRYAYSAAGDKKLYGFYRDLTYDSAGRLTAWSAETRFTVDEPEAC